MDLVFCFLWYFVLEEVVALKGLVCIVVVGLGLFLEFFSKLKIFT